MICAPIGKSTPFATKGGLVYQDLVRRNRRYEGDVEADDEDDSSLIIMLSRQQGPHEVPAHIDVSVNR
jgi:hypothetical protein